MLGEAYQSSIPLGSASLLSFRCDVASTILDCIWFLFLLLEIYFLSDNQLEILVP